MLTEFRDKAVSQYRSVSFTGWSVVYDILLVNLIETLNGWDVVLQLIKVFLIKNKECPWETFAI